MAHIGLHGMDLPDLSQRLQETGKLRPADGHPNAVAEFGQRAHDVTAEETRAAEDADERVELNVGYARPPSSIAEIRIALIVYKPAHANFTTTALPLTYTPRIHASVTSL